MSTLKALKMLLALSISITCPLSARADLYQDYAEYLEKIGPRTKQWADVYSRAREGHLAFHRVVLAQSAVRESSQRMREHLERVAGLPASLEGLSTTPSDRKQGAIDETRNLTKLAAFLQSHRLLKKAVKRSDAEVQRLKTSCDTDNLDYVFEENRLELVDPRVEPLSGIYVEFGDLFGALLSLIQSGIRVITNEDQNRKLSDIYAARSHLVLDRFSFREIAFEACRAAQAQVAEIKSSLTELVQAQQKVLEQIETQLDPEMRYQALTRKIDQNLIDQAETAAKNAMNRQEDGRTLVAETLIEVELSRQEASLNLIARQYADRSAPTEAIDHELESAAIRAFINGPLERLRMLITALEQRCAACARVTTFESRYQRLESQAFRSAAQIWTAAGQQTSHGDVK